MTDNWDASCKASGYVTATYAHSLVADCLGVPRTTFGAWVRGPSRRVTGVTSEHREVTFLGFCEGVVLAMFRETKLSLRMFRPSLDCLDIYRRSFGTVSIDDFCVDTTRDRLWDRTGECHTIPHVEETFGQLVHRYIGGITFESDGHPSRIVLPITRRSVLMVDPKFAFGQPVFVRSKAPLRPVLSRVAAGESPQEVAIDYGVPFEDLRSVLESPLWNKPRP